jgi:hypothetical protein
MTASFLSTTAEEVFVREVSDEGTPKNASVDEA